MKAFLGFVEKEFYHIFRDKRTLLILFGMPIIQVLLFGFAITTEIKDAKIAILDHSKDEVTRKISNKILSSDYFQSAENITNDKEVEKAFNKGIIKLVIVFENNFAKKLQKDNSANIQLLADATDPNTANILVNFASSIIVDYQLEMANLQKVPMIIIPEVKMMFNPELKGIFMFVPGVITIILMLVSAMMTSISIAREKELGTMEILMVSPIKPFQIIVGKVLVFLGLSILNATVILLLGRFVFGMPIYGSLILLMAECILFIITALSLGILISTIATTQQTAMIVSLLGLMLPTIMLSGFIFPIESMPKVLQVLSNIIPARWFITIIKDIMLKGTGMQFIWKETLILIIMTIIFISVSVKKFKFRLE